MLSLNTTGTPWNGLRTRPPARSASIARASAIARGFSDSIARNAGPFRSYIDSRARYSRTMSSEVTSPRVIASCSSETLFSNTVNGVGGCALRQLPVDDLRALPRASGRRRSGSRSELRARRAVTRAISDPAAGIFASAPA